MRELNEKSPLLPQAAKESDDLGSAVRSTHIGVTNLPNGIGIPESLERVGIAVIHGVGELSREIAYLRLGDHSIQFTGKWLARRSQIVPTTD